MTTADDGGARFRRHLCARRLYNAGIGRIVAYLSSLDQAAGEVDFAWQELVEIKKSGHGETELERLTSLEGAVRRID